MAGVSDEAGLAELADLLADGDAVVLSGAGLSTESGIPDYRGPTGAARPASPMTYQAFTGGEAARRRYWARSYQGWRRIGQAQPNAGHRALAGLDMRYRVSRIPSYSLCAINTVGWEPWRVTSTTSRSCSARSM